MHGGPGLRRRVTGSAAALTLAAVLVACGSAGGGGGQAGGPLRPPVATTAPASAWPQASGDAARSSATAATGPQTAHLRWQRKLGGAATPGPAVAVDGTVLIAANDGVLHDVDPATGADRWTFDGGSSYGVDLSTTPAVLPGGTILWPAPGDRLIALSPTGKKLWSEKLAGFVLSPAAVGGNRVYVADQGRHCASGGRDRSGNAVGSVGSSPGRLVDAPGRHQLLQPVGRPGRNCLRRERQDGDRDRRPRPVGHRPVDVPDHRHH